MQRRLSHTAAQDPAHQFGDLYSLLCNAVWLRVAVHHVQQNAGSETAGIDGKTMSNFRGNFDGYIEELTTTLKAETFEPCPVRRVYIPKPNSEKKRPLGIPILFDRIVQEALRMILEPIWEADFSVHSYGFRPNRSTYDAIAYIGNRLKGNGSSYQWVIEGDIKSYFDTIPHRRLIKAVKKRVADRKIRDLLWKFLRAGVMHRGQFDETLTGTPQGGIVSPLLANIYLDAMDKYMESKSLQLSESQRRRRREQGKGNFLLCCRCCQALLHIFSSPHSLGSVSHRPEPSGGFFGAQTSRLQCPSTRADADTINTGCNFPTTEMRETTGDLRWDRVRVHLLCLTVENAIDRATGGKRLDAAWPEMVANHASADRARPVWR